MERLERVVGRLEVLSAESHRPPGDFGEINGVNGGRTQTVVITGLCEGLLMLSFSLSSQETFLKICFKRLHNMPREK